MIKAVLPIPNHIVLLFVHTIKTDIQAAHIVLQCLAKETHILASNCLYQMPNKDSCMYTSKKAKSELFRQFFLSQFFYSPLSFPRDDFFRIVALLMSSRQTNYIVDIVFPHLINPVWLKCFGMPFFRHAIFSGF